MTSRKIALRISAAVQSTSLPPIPQAKTWASQYKATPEKPLLDMSQGVPGTPPPKFLLEAIGRCSSDPRSCGYCPMTGEPKLREALAKEMKRVYGRESDILPEDIAITAGCNMAFVTAVKALADAGDEVIVPVPWYFNHEMSLQMLGIKTVPLRTFANEGFLPSPEICASLITERTRAIVLVTPNNPTGAIYPPSLIAAFALLARKHGVALVVDETYRDFISHDVPHNLFTPGSLSKSSSIPADWSWRDNFVHLFSFSKSYCIPGHRLGALVAPSIVLEQTKTILDNIQICPPRPVQLAIYPLLEDLRPFISSTGEALAQRHNLFRSLLPSTWKIGSQGGYYAFVRHPFKGISATEVSRRMAVEGGVVTLPEAFFSPIPEAKEESESDDERWIRFSVANVDDDCVREVCERLEEIETAFNWKVDSD